MLSRRRFIISTAALTAVASLPHAASARAAGAGAPIPVTDDEISLEDLRAAERVQAIEFDDASRERMLEDVRGRAGRLRSMRAYELSNDVPSALQLNLNASGETPNPSSRRPRFVVEPFAGRPSLDEDLAFAGIPALAGMLRGGAVTSVELTRLFLGRLHRLDDRLLAVVTLTEGRALEQAERLDAELAEGRDRGPLHGIPYGAKDLLSVAGYPTTWGTEPFREQMLDQDAEAIRRLDEAGAVLVAKLTLGELAWGDVWYGGMTRNPWNPEQGSSGSSAGPGAAVAAGAVPFAIGSETYGSIVSPSYRNGVTGFRPTFGRVSTRGAMALSWSMDKLGPMTRSAVDAAIVFEAIRDSEGPDLGFAFDLHGSAAGMRVGYLADAFDAGEGDSGEADRAMLEVVRSLDVDLVPVALPRDLPIGELLIILEAEASAAFDELVRSGGLDRMARQDRFSWPNVMRHARHIPAVDYINANRHRTRLMQAMATLFEDIEALITPTYGNDALAITNLTGHPAVAIPAGFFPVEGNGRHRAPHAITVMGPLWGDEAPLRLAHAMQQRTEFHTRRPPVR